MISWAAGITGKLYSGMEKIKLSLDNSLQCITLFSFINTSGNIRKMAGATLG
jgi:hypothetical protein